MSVSVRRPVLGLTLIVAGMVGRADVAAGQEAARDLPARVDAIFARFDRTSPGCGVGLSKDGHALYTHGYGMANLEYGVPNTDSTVFESGSVAKQFTASALVLLEHDGKLSLDDDIRKYLPEVPSFGGQRITIRNLLTHTSGLRDQWGLLGIEGRGPGLQVHSALTSLDLVAHQKMLNFPPGSEYLYSNTGYALAGLIVQRVSGKTLGQFIAERLFQPLGMTHSQLRDDFTRIVPNRATAYSGSAATGYHTDMPFTNMVGNGGVLSTMSDLLRWNENLDHPVVGGQSYVDEMQTRMRLTNGRTISYALGLEVVDYDGIREVSHSGSTAGYRTFLARYPDQHVSVAVWCNYAGANPTMLAHQVADLVLVKQPVATAQAHATHVDVPPALVDQWVGTYRDPHTDHTMTLVATAEGLTTVAARGAGNAGARAVRFIPTGGADFVTPQWRVTFSGSRGHRAFMLVADGDTARYDEVRPAPASLPANDYVGTYASDELDVRFTVATRDGKLYLERRPYQEFELRPVYADDFQSGGGLGTLRFSRGADGRVTGFAFFAGRVLDVRFARVQSHR